MFKKVCAWVMGAAAAVMGFAANAASLLPAAALDAGFTNATDTVTDVVTEVLPFMIGLITIWAILSFVRRGLGKAGVG